jgi:predicted metal-binding membrane protein
MTEHRTGRREDWDATRKLLEREYAAALAVTLGLACGCWVVTVRQMNGMDMGVATSLGSFTFFLGLWVPMMAAMMLPAAVPAVSALTRAKRRATAAPLFVASYIAVWTLFGVAAYALYDQHGYTAAGALTIAAGLYELTPFKRACRRRCRESVRSGFEFGCYCVGSSVGLMAILLALGVMSVTWMSVVAAVVFMQKVLAPRASVDVLVALAMVALGMLLAFAPASVPALAGPM